MRWKVVSRTLLGLGLTWGGIALTAPAARGQVPESSVVPPAPRQPLIPENYRRNGMFTRFQPIVPPLPNDKYRDNYYLTYWSCRPARDHPNCFKHGGLYGLEWGSDCTQCYAPSFHGAPGVGTLGPACSYHNRGARWYENVFHPFRPVCMYYEGGCWVPVYDLDPLVTGPGPFPWPFLFRDQHGGKHL